MVGFRRRVTIWSREEGKKEGKRKGNSATSDNPLDRYRLTREILSGSGRESSKSPRRSRRREEQHEMDVRTRR